MNQEQLQEQNKDLKEVLHAATSLLSKVPVGSNNVYLDGFEENLQAYMEIRNLYDLKYGLEPIKH